MARRRKNGRPRMLVRDRRTEIAQIPLTAAERESFGAAAAKERVPLAEWFRRAARALARRAT